MSDRVKGCGVPEKLEKCIAVTFASPSGDSFDDNERPGYDGHADQYDKNRFPKKIALGDEMTESDIAGCSFHFVMFSVGGTGGLFAAQVEPVRDDGHGEERAAMFGVGVECAVSRRFQSRFIQSAES